MIRSRDTGFGPFCCLGTPFYGGTGNFNIWQYGDLQRGQSILPCHADLHPVQHTNFIDPGLLSRGICPVEAPSIRRIGDYSAVSKRTWKLTATIGGRVYYPREIGRDPQGARLKR